MSNSQRALNFNRLEDELGLARALLDKTGRDLFKGITNPADRQAAARIAIIVNRLETEFGATYQRIYGEALPERVRLTPPKTQRRETAA